MGDIIRSNKIKVNNPNKKHMFFADPNNVLSMKMATYYQYKLQNSFICSSFSLLAIIALFYIGTNGETRQEITDKLGLTNSDKVYEGLYQIMNLLNKSETVSINCALIINSNLKKHVKKEYINKVKKLGVVDFFDNTKPQVIVNKINKWIENNTKGLIKNVLDTKVINRLTEFILVNTIYFKSNWKVKR